MPPLDFETGDGDRRLQTPPPEAVEDSDLPAESYQLQIGDEIDWGGLHSIYDRYDSIKGTANPKSNNHYTPRQRSTSTNHLPAKATIVGLSGTVRTSRRRHPDPGTFPRKASGGTSGGTSGRSAAAESEPESPKVSCFGKVRMESEPGSGRRSPGFWTGIASLFSCGGGEEGEDRSSPAANIPAMLPAKNVLDPGEDGKKEQEALWRRRRNGESLEVVVVVHERNHGSNGGPTTI